MLDILSDIQSQIERNRWVSDYEVFLQEIDRVQINANDELSKFTNTKHNGIALRLLSNENRLVHFACSISMIPLLSNLNPPKSTQNIIDSKLFVKLKKSKLRSISGDEGFTTSISKEFIQKLTGTLLELDKEDHIHNEQNLCMLKEKRVIFNTLSDPMRDTSFKMKYEVNSSFKDSSFYSSSYRYDMSRGYNIDFQDILNKSNQSLVHQNMNKLNLDLSSLTSVVIHPRIVGQLLMDFANNNFLDENIPKGNVSIPEDAISGEHTPMNPCHPDDYLQILRMLSVFYNHERYQNAKEYPREVSEGTSARNDYCPYCGKAKGHPLSVCCGEIHGTHKINQEGET